MCLRQASFTSAIVRARDLLLEFDVEGHSAALVLIGEEARGEGGVLRSLDVAGLQPAFLRGSEFVGGETFLYGLFQFFVEGGL